MKEIKLDVLVLGTGVAGKTVAEECKKAGKSVGVVENRVLGGTCSNRGCDPKKVILGATEVLQLSMDLQSKGVDRITGIDWQTLQKFKKSFTEKIPSSTEEDFKEIGIKIFKGAPQFLGPNTIITKDYKINADKIVIATGLIPRPLDIAGAEFLSHSDDFLSFDEMPTSILFLGAGYIGLELAHIAARAGCEVTIIDRGERILDNFEERLADLLLEDSKTLGINFIFNADVRSIRKNSSNYLITYDTEGSEKEICSETVINTTGRIPSIDNMNLQKGNVASNENGIAVDNHLRSKSNSNIYACGDVSDIGPPLSPLAGYQGAIVAKNILNECTEEIQLPTVPTVVFTIPQLAKVGLSEEEATSRYKNIVIKQGNAKNWYNNKRINGSSYSYKIILNERTDKIVGAHIIGPEAGETINLFAMAINNGMTAKAFSNNIFTYPSWSNDLKAMLD